MQEGGPICNGAPVFFTYNGGANVDEFSPHFLYLLLIFCYFHSKLSTTLQIQLNDQCD